MTVTWYHKYLSLLSRKLYLRSCKPHSFLIFYFCFIQRLPWYSSKVKRTGIMPRLVSARVDVHSVFFGFEYSELLIYILFKAVNFTWKVNLSMIKSGIYMNFWCMDISLRSINHFCSHGQTNLRVCFIFCWVFLNYFFLSKCTGCTPLTSGVWNCSTNLLHS